MSDDTFKIGILISGRGSNMLSIIEAVEDGYIPNAKVSLVISNKPDALGLKKAKEHGIETRVIKAKDYPDKESYDRALIKELDNAGVNLVCLAGFMRIMSPLFVSHFKDRCINIHPALLPSFPGLHGQKQALEYGVKYSGATVHFVDEGVDTGPIILQAVVPVMDDDTEETLSQRILEQEHRIYPEAVRLIRLGKLDIQGRRVRLIKD